MTSEQEPIIAGNVYDKYTTRNPAYAWVVSKYFESLDEMLASVKVKNVLEIGCGEGFMSEYVRVRLGAAHITALDISVDVVATGHASYGDIDFLCANAYRLPFSPNEFDLVLALESLEHIKYAEHAMGEIARVGSRYFLASVPHEPYWRILNLLRGAYVSSLGNTPGHVRHWGKRGFVQSLEALFEVEALFSPFPWTMAMCRIK